MTRGGSRYPSALRRAAVRAYLGGKSSSEVGDELGVSWATVLQWVRAAGHEIRPHRQSEAVRAYLEGLPSPGVGREFGVAAATALRFAMRTRCARTRCAPVSRADPSGA